MSHPDTGGLAETPPMGWNSWNAFGKDVDEERIRAQADAMVDTGLRDAGYDYLVLDGGWRAPERDADGNMRPNDDFPSGIGALADYVHDRGLQFGLHQAVGVQDCAGETPGTQSAPGGEPQDARLFAEWGIDFLKYDLCLYDYPGPAVSRRAETRKAYERMGRALAAVDRDVVYSVSEYGRNRPWLWARQAGAHMWRTTSDIADTWDSVTSILDAQVRLAEYAGPGGWNDPDMLQVGNGGMTVAEYRSHVSLWSVLGAPLFAGTDLTSIDDEALALLTNEDVIAVNQDPAGVPGYRVRGHRHDVWAKPLEGGAVAVVLCNRGDREAELYTCADELGLPVADSYLLRELWTGAERETDGAVTATVAPHDSAMFRVEPPAR